MHRYSVWLSLLFCLLVGLWLPAQAKTGYRRAKRTPRPAQSLFVPLTAKPFATTATSVLAGDRLMIRLGGKAVKIGLYGVACPKPEQEGFDEAQAFTEGFVTDKSLSVRWKGKDRRGFRYAWVMVEGKSLNQALLEQGWAWWDFRQAPKAAALKGWHQKNVSGNRGLWNLSDPVAPWKWRGPATDSADARQGSGEPVPSGALSSGPSTGDSDTTVYVTNTGDKYHRAGCSYLRRSANPMSLSAARSQGYTACSRCF